jgi:hypothetical protein
MATARITALEEQMKGLVARISALEAVPAKKPRAKKAAAAAGASDEEKEPQTQSAWIVHSSRVSALLKEHEDAKNAARKARFAFCKHLRGICNDDYKSLTDEAILEEARTWVAPAKKPEPVAEESADEEPAPKAKTTPAKKPAPVVAPAAPKKASKASAKNASKKAAGGGSDSENPFDDV